ncbi:MAG TPA: tetratricopeptide repeat protein [Pyrinomonadaceae bacterium]|nr:tetratricopeptide repeat protein [Pyrinomonadaceae bacterium]
MNLSEPDVFEAAIQAEKARNFDEALRLYERASLIDPAAPHPRLRLASLLHDTGKWKESIRVARQLTKRWPTFSFSYVVIARSYAELGRWKLAERFYRQSLALKQEPWVWVLLAKALDRQGRHDEAEECLRKALKVDPDYDEAHYNLGYIYRAKGKLALAEKHLRRAIEIDPNYGLAYAELGQLLMGQNGKTNEAVSCLRKALHHNPDDGWSRAYLANALWRLRKLKAAEEQYRRLMEIWPNHSLPYWTYGYFLAAERKDNSTAERYLRRAVEIEPNGAQTHYHLGKHLLLTDRVEEAKRFITKAARLGDSRARELLQQIKGSRSNAFS